MSRLENSFAHRSRASLVVEMRLFWLPSMDQNELDARARFASGEDDTGSSGGEFIIFSRPYRESMVSTTAMESAPQRGTDRDCHKANRGTKDLT